MRASWTVSPVDWGLQPKAPASGRRAFHLGGSGLTGGSIRVAGDLGEWSLLPPGLLGCPRGPLLVVGGQRLGEVLRGVFRTLVDDLSGLRIEFGVARLHLLQLLGGDRISDDSALEPIRDRLTIAAAHDCDATDGVELLAGSMP